MRFIYLGLLSSVLQSLLNVSAPLAGDKPPLAIKSVHRVPNTILVRVLEPIVQNLKPIEPYVYSPKQRLLETGERCTIHFGGRVEVIKYIASKVVAKYSNLVGDDDIECPHGTLFTIHVKTLGTFNDSFFNKIRVARSVDKEVRTILSRKNKNPVQSVGSLFVGQTHSIPMDKWVDLLTLNLSGRSFENFVIHKINTDNSSCVIDRGELLHVLGFRNNSLEALVSYHPRIRRAGTSCEVGGMFFVKIEELKDYNTDYRDFLEVRRSDRRVVEAILDQKGDTTKLEDFWIGQVLESSSRDWRRVLVKTEQSYRNDSSRLDSDEEEYCITEVGGVLTILGFDTPKNRALVRYSPLSTPGGAACPNGAVFFMSIKELGKQKL